MAAADETRRRIERDLHDGIQQRLVSLGLQLRGADGPTAARGTGLVGLRDRVEALGGKLHVTGPAGCGTTLQIQLPLDGQTSAASPES
ncbi:histidine kinase [Kribbella sp. NPDC055110]